MQMRSAFPWDPMVQAPGGIFEKFPGQLAGVPRFGFAASAKEADDDADEERPQDDGYRILLSAFAAGPERFLGAHLGQAGHPVGGGGGEIF